MLDNIISFFAVFTIYVAMAIEFSGFPHASHLVQYTVAAHSGKKIESNEEPRSGEQALLFWQTLLTLVWIFCRSTLAVLSWDNWSICHAHRTCVNKMAA